MGWEEALIAMDLGSDLNVYVRSHNLGVVSGPDSTLRMASSGRIRLPDVAFVARERLPATRQKIPTLAPDLAVEILSEGNTADEIAEKLLEYFQSGTRLARVVDPPTRSVRVYHAPGDPTRVLDQSAFLDGEHVLPGFSLPVASLFRSIPPARGGPQGWSIAFGV